MNRIHFGRDTFGTNRRSFIPSLSLSLRTHLLKDVYSLLADLIDWSDKVLLARTNDTKGSIQTDDRYKKLALDLLQAIKVPTASVFLIVSTNFSSDLYLSSMRYISLTQHRHPFGLFSKLSINEQVFACLHRTTHWQRLHLFSSFDDLAPVLPPKRERRPMSSSAAILSSRSRNHDETSDALLFSSSPNITKQEKDNDEHIQLIVNDINQIVEKYTRELDDALRTKSAVRSPSTDHLAERKQLSIPSSHRHDSFDTLCETNVSKIMKITTTKRTVDNGQGTIDKKESCQTYNGINYSFQSPNGDFQTQKCTVTNRQKSNDDHEQEKTIVTARTNVSETDPPPLPPKRKTGRQRMGLRQS